jgi:hypothetical protein
MIPDCKEKKRAHVWNYDTPKSQQFPDQQRAKPIFITAEYRCTPMRNALSI